MSVPLESESSGGVPGEGLEDADRLAALGEQGEAGMPEVVEANGGEARLLEEGLRVAVCDILGVFGYLASGF